jgi:hypothetical protein
VWSITHDLQRGIGHLEAEGALPDAFGPIRDRLSAKQVGQGDADYIFDVPVEVANALTGFRYNEIILGAPGEPYEELAKRGRETKWWQVWR